VLENPSMNKPYSAGGSYSADKALLPKENGIAITKNGVGMWWKASFKGGPRLVESVKIKNRTNCCGERLRLVRVDIGGVECGKLPSSTKTNQWYTVKCAKPLVGGEIQLTTTVANYLQISGVKVFGWSASSGTTVEETGDEVCKDAKCKTYRGV
jgi:hypothetical protein